MVYDVIVIGGGAAGVFAAIAAKETNPHAQVILLEKSSSLLGKVRISGGGRCNVTHACFDPLTLSKNYPRGSQELIGPFHHFQPQDTINWFNKRGVLLKTENDGRMFPVTDSSQTIIDCLTTELKKHGVIVSFRQNITSITKNSLFEIHLENQEPLLGKNLILATGSHPLGHKWAESLGHTIKSPVPSLFTFNIPTSPLKELSGICLEKVEISLAKTSLSQTGPVLITHFGFSGPAVIKLSAWGARYLHEKNYEAELYINWLPELSQEAILTKLLSLKKTSPQKSLLSENPFKFPRNFWKTWLSLCGSSISDTIGTSSNKDLSVLSKKLNQDIYLISGKTTHKEEFVTCGGVDLKEILFKTMRSKKCPGLFFAGEILDIDGVTGGFNFQNAWTTAFIAGSSIAY